MPYSHPGRSKKGHSRPFRLAFSSAIDGFGLDARHRRRWRLLPLTPSLFGGCHASLIQQEAVSERLERTSAAVGRRERIMPRKPNYDFERKERERAKAAKAAERAKAKAEAKAQSANGTASAETIPTGEPEGPV
jgi:hypothetical protein